MKGLPFSNIYSGNTLSFFVGSVPDILKGPFKHLNDSLTLYYVSARQSPTLLYTSILKKVPHPGGAFPYSQL